MTRDLDSVQGKHREGSGQSGATGRCAGPCKGSGGELALASQPQRAERDPRERSDSNPASAGELMLGPIGKRASQKRVLEPASVGEGARGKEASALCWGEQHQAGSGRGGAAGPSRDLHQVAVKLRTLRLNQRDCAQWNTWHDVHSGIHLTATIVNGALAGIAVPQAIGRLNSRELQSSHPPRRGGSSIIKELRMVVLSIARFGGCSLGAQRVGCEGRRHLRVRLERGVCIASAW